MKFAQDTGAGSYRVRSYEPGRIRINDELLETSVVVSADALVRDWPPETLSELTEAHLAAALLGDPEVLILGTGPTQQFPDRALLRSFFQRGVGIEVMDTAAACRTFNILTAEARRVTAALLLR